METLLLIMICVIAIPVSIFTLEVLFSLLPQRHVKSCMDDVPTFVVLIPAHNESGTINNTLDNIKGQLSEKGQLLVVADNCTDDTATIARAYGAEVIERTHENNCGKGYALDFGVRHLEGAPPDVVVVIDADCLLEDGTLQKLVCAAVTHNRPIQALYLMTYINPSLKQRISEFAWLVKNHVRPLGLFNVGLPCQLMGTGMAFPWSIILTASLASSNIVEDMKMGLDIALAGHAPLFLPDARVTSTFPESTVAEKSQKKRWEHGHLNMMATVLPKSFCMAILKTSKNILAMSLDLTVPPLALLSLITALLFIASFLVMAIYNTKVAFFLCLTILVMLIFTTFIAWFRWGRKVVSFLDLFLIPFYIVSKVPLYLSAVFKRQKEWIRTDRD